MTPDPEQFRVRLETERGRVVAALEHLHRQHPGSLVALSFEPVDA